MNAVVPLVLVAVVVGIVDVFAYNGLVNARQDVADAWAVVDSELERRHHLVPALVESVRASAAHERELLNELVERERAAAQVEEHSSVERSDSERALGRAARSVVALRERYPALDSQANFSRLQHDLAITEDRIGAARRFHNIKVAELNRRTESFPSNVVASVHRIGPGVYFAV